jgi:cbb3-type cytochrome oxidase maturation protein
MTVLATLIPVSLVLGLLGLGAFVWSLKSHQYDDLEGDQHRALFGGNDDAPKT